MSFSVCSKLLAGILMLAGGCVAISEAAAMQLSFTINQKTYVQNLPDSAAVQSLAQVLPVTVTFEDYGSTERIAYLPKKLSVSSNVSCVPRTGDFTYYVPWGNLAVFKKDFRASSGLLYFGSLEPELLQAIIDSDDHQVTIQLVQE